MKNNEIIRYGLILFTITFVVALVLSGVNALTKDRIAQIALIEQEQAKKAVLSTVSYDNLKKLEFNNNDSIVKGVWAAQKESKSVAYVANVNPMGYGGPIDMMVGLSLDFKVLDVKIISSLETAGLGSKASEPKFKDQFKGKSKGITVKKNGTPSDNEIVAITGATITSKAVTKGVNTSIDEISNMVKSVVSSVRGDTVNE